MLKKINASRFEKKMGNGRTKPCLITCEGLGADSEEDIELVVKFSAGCFEKEKNLAVEAIAAMLAADLGLPVPEPFLVVIDEAFIESMDDAEIRHHIGSSSRVAFGSKRLPDGFGAWATHGRIPKELTQETAEVFVFDAIIANADRRPVNPNCLTTGSQIGIFDHELSFAMKQTLFWRAPWDEGGFDNIAEPDNHIFAPCYFEEKPVQLDRFKAAWDGLASERFQEYFQALPAEWNLDQNYLSEIMGYLAHVKENIGAVIDAGLEKLR